jgi:hypothetical protein
VALSGSSSGLEHRGRQMLGSNNRRLFDPEQERRMRRWEMVAREDNKCEGLEGAKKLQ